jgi:putative ABC transport system permease protein
VAPVDQGVDVLTANGTSWTSPTIATVPSYLQIENRQVQFGSFLTASEERGSAPVIVLGSTVSTELFGGGDPVGQAVSIAGLQFQVVGVLASAGSSASTNQDDQSFLPLSTYETLLKGTGGDSVSEIIIQASNSSTISAAYQEADNLLLQLHQITTPASADFTITSQTQVLSAALTVSQTLTFLLTGIAAVSLLVGGIGVMNIMLVSVSERVKEIGLRKALGATPGVIRNQFLLEALGLGLFGGLLGTGLGFVAAYCVDHYSTNHLVLSATVVGGSVAISAVIALVFGVYPATRAAALTPIDALRSE